VNPLAHYEQFGWKEGRDPSAHFDTTGYLAANPDVAAAGVNPLDHYLINASMRVARWSTTACVGGGRTGPSPSQPMPPSMGISITDYVVTSQVNGPP
jgi:hypothetical protein